MGSCWQPTPTAPPTPPPKLHAGTGTRGGCEQGGVAERQTSQVPIWEGVPRVRLFCLPSAHLLWEPRPSLAPRVERWRHWARFSRGRLGALFFGFFRGLDWPRVCYGGGGRGGRAGIVEWLRDQRVSPLSGWIYPMAATAPTRQSDPAPRPSCFSGVWRRGGCAPSFGRWLAGCDVACNMDGPARGPPGSARAPRGTGGASPLFAAWIGRPAPPHEPGAPEECRVSGAPVQPQNQLGRPSTPPLRASLPITRRAQHTAGRRGRDRGLVAAGPPPPPLPVTRRGARPTGGQFPLFFRRRSFFLCGPRHETAAVRRSSLACNRRSGSRATRDPFTLPLSPAASSPR